MSRETSRLPRYLLTRIHALGLVCAALGCGSGLEREARRSAELEARGLVEVDFFETEGHAFSWADRQAIERIAEATVREVREHLPGLPRRIVLRAQSADAGQVDSETGADSVATPPNHVLWTVDTKRAGGAGAIAEGQLRATLFHALHHLLRDAAVPQAALLERAITEGLAIAFERDYGGIAKPWGWYPSDAAIWVDELRQVPDDAAQEPWLARHPDGRRWIAMRAGTFLVDRAVRVSGRTPAELATLPAQAIIELADAAR